MRRRLGPVKTFRPKPRLLLLGVALFSTNPALATPDVSIWHKLHPVFTLTGGASISQLGQSQLFTPLDLCSYRYNPTGSNSANAFWGGFAGSVIKRTASQGLIIGLGYYQPTTLTTQGDLTQGADPPSDNTYQYRYNTQSQQLLAESKWYWLTNKSIQPFFILGIGVAFNRTFDYQTNVPPFFEFTPAFSNHSQTNFTYAVGPGVDVTLTQSFRLGVAYRFTYLGGANTGSGHIDEIPITNLLKQSHLHANQFLTQLTFIPWINE